MADPTPDELDVVAFSAADAAELGKMLRDWRAGNLGKGPDSGDNETASKTETIIAEIKTNATGGGYYWMTLIRNGLDDGTGTANLKIEDLGDEYTPSRSDTGKILGRYFPEINTSNHGLTVGTPYRCVIARRQKKGMMVVDILGGGVLGTGQYKDDYYKMVAQNAAGWAPITARAMT